MNINRNIILINIAILGSLIFAIFRYPILQLLYILPGIILFILSYKFNFKNLSYLLFFLSMIIIYVLAKSLIDFDLKIIYDIGRLISHIGIALAFIKTKATYKILGIYVLLMFLVLSILIILNIDPRYILNRSGENMLNFIAIYLVSSFNISYYKEKNKFLVFPIILLLIVSFWTAGRTAIIVSLLMLITIILHRILQTKKFDKHIKKIFVFGLISFAALAIVSSGTLDNIIYKFGDRNVFIVGDPRYRIFFDYISKMNIKTIFFGFKSIERIFSGFYNIHNSFLDFHSYFGIIAIIFYLYLVWIIFKAIQKKEIILSIFFLLMMVRAFTDIVILIGFLDYLFYYVLLVIKDTITYIKNRRLEIL
jgi:hypothetical protein